MKYHNINKSYLQQYFAGHTTALENAMIETWLEDENNQELFFEVLEEWERTNLQYHVDTSKALGVLESKLHQFGADDKDTYRPDNPVRNWFYHSGWLMAACMAALIFFAVLFWNQIWFATYETSLAETRIIELEDGSVVTLNASSTLQTPRWMMWFTDRKVWLQGEAFFSVEKEPGRKFLVHTRYLDVEVLGTRFNVNDRHETTRVVLQEGKIKVLSNKGPRKELALLSEAGDYLETGSDQNSLITKKVDETLFTSWPKKKLKFDNALVSDVIGLINEYYGVSIDCGDSTVLKRRFTGTLPNDHLNIVLGTLSNIYNTKFLTKNNTSPEE